LNIFQPKAALNYADNLVHTHSEVSEKPYDQGDTGEPGKHHFKVKWLIYTYCWMVLDDFLSPADMNTDIDPGMELEPEQPGNVLDEVSYLYLLLDGV
jgi:hypothetical protein